MKKKKKIRKILHIEQDSLSKTEIKLKKNMFNPLYIYFYLKKIRFFGSDLDFLI